MKLIALLASLSLCVFFLQFFFNLFLTMSVLLNQNPLSQIYKTQNKRIYKLWISTSKIANIFPGIISGHQILVGTHSHNCVHGWCQWATADIKMRQDWWWNFFCKSFLYTIVAYIGVCVAANINYQILRRTKHYKKVPKSFPHLVIKHCFYA